MIGGVRSQQLQGADAQSKRGACRNWVSVQVGAWGLGCIHTIGWNGTTKQCTCHPTLPVTVHGREQDWGCLVRELG